MLVTLFRLVEIEAGGRIEIDGVDIRSVSTQKLRQSLSIIPQGKILPELSCSSMYIANHAVETRRIYCSHTNLLLFFVYLDFRPDPVLFVGSVASNLDATGKASEEEMWQALQAASPSLAEQFKQSQGLDTSVSEGGKNLSLGQRQLLCLARALLRRSKILVLDEATASVDPTTDQEVQATIRREFVDKGVTVITVAHRLQTVLSSDKIAVLGNGEVLEYGTPKELLQNKDGEFRRLFDADRLSKKKGAKQSKSVAAAA